jgi:2-oxoisovalerate dehydrogenase E1 component alpha subunit
VMSKAVARARAGKGPTLIEAVTYRFGPHTTADDATRYRPPEEVEEWVNEKDPLLRYTRLLKKEGLLTDEEEKTWEETCKEKMDQAISRAEKEEPAPPGHMFAHVYETLSANEKRQKQQLEERDHRR